MLPKKHRPQIVVKQQYRNKKRRNRRRRNRARRQYNKRPRIPPAPPIPDYLVKPKIPPPPPIPKEWLMATQATQTSEPEKSELKKSEGTVSKIAKWLKSWVY